MSQAIRAIYEKGQLRLMDAITLQDGEEVFLTIHQTSENQFRAILGDLVVRYPQSLPADDDINEAELLAEVQESLTGIGLSEAIIQERGEGL